MDTAINVLTCECLAGTEALASRSCAPESNKISPSTIRQPLDDGGAVVWEGGFESEAGLFMFAEYADRASRRRSLRALRRRSRLRQERSLRPLRSPVCVCARMCMGVCVCVCVHMYGCVCVCVCITGSLQSET